MSQQHIFSRITGTENYDKKGLKNKSKHLDFVGLCMYSESTLKTYLHQWAKKYFTEDDIINEKGYLYIKGDLPILLTAHMDTVHVKLVRDFYEYQGNIVSSPQGIGGDDRCGIYMIKKIIETTKLRPSILFCEQEEVGGIGSNLFCKSKHIEDLKSMLFLIELDRAHSSDLVFYDDENEEFHNWCAKITGYKEAWGTFSDISHLCPYCGVAGVNISCGYYNAHTTSEYVNIEKMETSIQKTIELIEAGIEDGVQYEYIENTYYNYGYGYGYGDYYGSSKEKDNHYVFYWDTYNNEEIITAKNEDEAIGKLLQKHPDLTWNEIEDWYKWEGGIFQYGGTNDGTQ